MTTDFLKVYVYKLRFKSVRDTTVTEQAQGRPDRDYTFTEKKSGKSQ